MDFWSGGFQCARPHTYGNPHTHISFFHDDNKKNIMYLSSPSLFPSLLYYCWRGAGSVIFLFIFLERYLFISYLRHAYEYVQMKDITDLKFSLATLAYVFGDPESRGFGKGWSPKICATMAKKKVQMTPPTLRIAVWEILGFGSRKRTWIPIYDEALPLCKFI